MNMMKAALLLAAASTAIAVPARAQLTDDSFRNPPHTAKPHIWWHWVDGFVTKDGIIADLDAFQRAGIGGVQLFNVGGMVGRARERGNADIVKIDDRTAYRMFSIEWYDLIAFAAQEARKRNIDFVYQSTPGWATIGGPWIKPGESMRRLAWSRIEVPGGRALTAPLPYPAATLGSIQDAADVAGQTRAPLYYQDIRIIAARVAPMDRPLPQLAITGSTQPSSDLGGLVNGRSGVAYPINGDSEDGVMLPALKAGTAVTLTYRYPRPVAVRSLNLSLKLLEGDLVRITLSARRPDGRWTDLRTIEQEFGDSNVAGPWTMAYSLPSSRASEYRLTLLPVGPISASPRLYEARLAPEAVLDCRERQTGHVSYAAPLPICAWTQSPPATMADVVDLTDRLRPDGRLDWTPPKGHWAIWRFGSLPTGSDVGPAPLGADGYETDKLSVASLSTHIREGLDPVVDVLRASGGGAPDLLVDSWEAGTQTWTPGLEAEFRRQNGYDMTPWLPALAGEVIGSAVQTQRFLFDYRRLISTLTLDASYRGLAAYARSQGTKLHSEAPGTGHNGVLDRYAAIASVDIPMSEFWVFDWPINQTRQNGDARTVSSVAMLHDKPIVAAEAFTSLPNAGAHSHALKHYKTIGDRQYANGVNRFVLHSAVHQPFADLWPGFHLFNFGANFARTSPWFDATMPAWVSYLTRSQSLLQKGRKVADIFVYVGDDVPNGMADLRRLPPIPEGYDHVEGSDHALLTRLLPTDSGVRLPTGESFAAILLPDTDRMTVPVARHLRTLVEAGATIVGPRPVASPSLAEGDAGDAAVRAVADALWGPDGAGRLGSTERLDRRVGKGRVVHGIPLAELLPEPDIRIAEGDPDAIVWHHRKVEGAHIFFVANTTETDWMGLFDLRVAGLQPELWQAESGTIQKLDLFTADGKRTRVPLRLTAAQSAFLVFRNPVQAPVTIRQGAKPVDWRLALQPSPGCYTLAGPGGTRQLSVADIRPERPLTGEWQRSFPAQRGSSTPHSDVVTALTSWSDDSNPSVRGFAGTATYRTSFDLAATDLSASHRLMLDLGKVDVAAEVELNGRTLPTLWRAPYRVAIDGAARVGTNQLVVRVTNTAFNALASEAALPPEQRLSWTSATIFRKDTPLIAAGLQGPARLIGEPRALTDIAATGSPRCAAEPTAEKGR